MPSPRMRLGCLGLVYVRLNQERLSPLQSITTAIVVGSTSEPSQTQSLMFQTGLVEPITDPARERNGKNPDA